MGGFGSTRWGFHSKRTTVEEARTLDLAELARAGCLVPGYSGRVTWSRDEKQTAAIGYTVRPEGESFVLVLSYTWTSRGESASRDVELPVLLEALPMRFGGVRWWGRCPLQVNGQPCRRRIRKLYLAGESRYFGCRVCHRLTYEIAQTHDKGLDALRRNPEILDRILANLEGASVRELGLVLKATRYQR